MACFVYFVQAPANGLIKIGTTGGHPGERLKALAAGSPVPLVPLGFIPGGHWEEKRMHARFASLRRHGEWFEPGERLLYFISRWARPWTEAKELTSAEAFAAIDARMKWVREEAARRGIDVGAMALDRARPPGSPRLLINMPKPGVA